MNEMPNSPVCERAPDLMAFLYDEMNERETREFELHLQQCGGCREELTSFGMVRESIVAWRDEALAGFVSTPLPAKKSALAALRQFFDLSPLWLKAATGFAVLAFCALAALLFVNSMNEPQPQIVSRSDAIYTQEEVDRLVKEALANQQPVPEKAAPPMVVVADTPPQQGEAPRQVKRDRRPLSRSEREQLAADLRLLPDDDDDLNLPGDRINE